MELARDYLASHAPDPQQGRKAATETAAAWLSGQGVDLTPAIWPLIAAMTADAWVIGGCSAAAMADGDREADTGDWRPGDEDSARDRLDALGLGAGFAAAAGSQQRAAQQMASGFMTSMGRALADGAASGLNATALGASLVSALTGPDHISRSVLGLLAIGTGAAALALYQLRNVRSVRWVTDGPNPCPVCTANEAGSPYRLAGAPTVPAHPVCRCQVIPA